ncbi:TRAP transporter substrate-binding protein DctP [Aquibium sp. LZ166]|uniref:TRAP transporter substrate-binding protein DctP n=1 Tax=Aquibium pacificus TaxID=3153579 RepID=A0ABV3SMR7_9HYPH
MLLSAGTINAEEFRLLSSWDNTNPAVRGVAIPFARLVEEASGGEIKLLMSGPETIPPFEQLEPVSSGVFQLLFTHTAYHTGTTSIGMAIDAIDATSQELRDQGIWDWFDQYYQAHNLKLIALPSVKGGYQLVLREPLTDAGDLAGRKIRGTPTYFGVFEMLGATPVTLPPAEVYAALERGVADGAAWGAYGILANRWHEVAPNLMRPAIGYSGLPIFMNLDTWKALPPERQALFLEQGERVEELWGTEYAQMVNKEEQTLINEHNVQITQLPEDKASQLNAAFADGIWRIIDKQNPEKGQELREFLATKGLMK